MALGSSPVEIQLTGVGVQGPQGEQGIQGIQGPVDPLTAEYRADALAAAEATALDVITVNAAVVVATDKASEAEVAADAAIAAKEAAEDIAGNVSESRELTKAALDANIAAYVNGQSIIVAKDETRYNESSVYTKTAGVAVFSHAFDAISPHYDSLNRPVVPSRFLNHRNGGLKLRKALSDIRSGARKALKIMTIGDSLVGTSWSTVNIQLMKELEGWMNSTPIYAHSLAVLNYGTFSDSAACSAGPRNYTGTVREKLDYDAAWDGSLVWLDAGQASNFSQGGLAAQGDKIYIPIIKEPGAGTVKIEIANATTPPALGGSWSNPTVDQITSGHALTGVELLVNVNGAFGVEMVILSVALGSWTVKVTQTAGGRVRVRNPMHEVTTASAFNTWRIGSASNDFSATLASAATIEGRQIAAYDPDIIIVETDDKLLAYQNILPLIETAINNAGLTHDPLVLLVINPFYSNGPYSDADIIARAEYCHNFVANRLGWDVLDGLALSGGLAEATAAGWNNDGIHYSDQIARWMTRTWLTTRGYLPYQPQGGGYASDEVILKGPVSAANGSGRPLLAGNIPGILLQATAFDTGTCVWAGTAAGGASYARGNAGDIVLTSGSGAGATVGAFINQNGSLLGINQGNIRGESRGFACRVRTTTAWDALTLGFILQRADGATWNSGYNGTLTGQGWGFRFRFDGTNILIEGICWLNGALVVSALSAILPAGAASTVKDLTVLCTPQAINTSKGTLKWYAGTTLLGTSQYDHSGVFLPPRAELTNGATAANRTLQFMPPKLLSDPQ